ncbi:ciliary microtubule inner protein 4-like isoform X2 [Ptychodera flava]|uniref:ciliary microtubule inner protein 4-like isoform X2 n=1 Tax=Ptychodera flava TaxID=63121 RepID=UPI00396A9BF2
MAAKTYMDLKAKRSKAVAPRTLFGTNVEIKRDGDTPGRTTPIKQTPKKRGPVGLEKLMKYQQPGDSERLFESQVDYKKQWQSTSHAKEKLREVEQNALFFNPDPHTLGSHQVREPFKPAHITDANPYKTDVKLSATDIAHPELFNNVGLGGRGDYNYDSYRNPRLRDNSGYKHTGHALGKSGRLAYSGNSRTGIGVSANPGQGEYYSPITQSNKQAPRRAHSQTNGHVPANIRHRYGTQIMADLVGDEKQISEGVEGMRTPVRKPRTQNEVESDRKLVQTSQGYQALSNHLRYDHFSGVPLNEIRSLNTDSYTEDVFKAAERQYPPKFAILRNEDSRWNEDNVIRDRMKKAWDEVMAKPSKE